MANFTSSFGNFTIRPGLYRVWVPLHDDGKAPLISIWIDPTMAAFEAQACREGLGIPGISEGLFAEEIEDPGRPMAVAAMRGHVAA